MKKITPTLALSALALTLAACGAGAPTAQEAAQQIAEKQSGAKVSEITGENDPNGLVGRPNGPKESASVAWLDCTTPLSVECGAVVETWGDEDAARKRAEYIQGILKESPMLGSEWDYVDGPTLVRVTGELTREQSDALNVIDGKLVQP